MKKLGALFILLSVVFILSGCGGGGGGMFGGSSSDNLTSSGSSGSMKFTINWPQAGGKSAVLASAYSIKISVCVPTQSSTSGGASSDSVSARTADTNTTSYDRVVNAIAIRHNTNNSTESISINGVPVGSKTVIVQAYNASGNETGYGSQAVTIVKGKNDAAAVTLTDGVFPYTITSALDTQVSTESTTYPNINTIYPIGGPVDTTVTLSGTGFGDYTNASVVKFIIPNSQNWTSITPITWSNDTITFKIPESAATGQIYVKVYNGSQNSNNVNFTVTNTSSGPQITNSTPITVTAGSNFIITGTGFGSSKTSASNVYFGALAAANITSWSDTEILCVVPTSVINGNLKVTVNGIDSNAVAYTVSGGGLQWAAIPGFPGGSLQLAGVWMTDNPYRVYVAGNNGNTGAAFLYNNSGWISMSAPNYGYTGVFGFNDGTSSSKVFAVGLTSSGARIVSGGLGANTWTNLTPAFPLGGYWPAANLFYSRDLWVKDPNNLFVAGADNGSSPHQGMIGAYVNSNWNNMPGDPARAAQATILNDIWISANNVGFVVGPDGYTRMYDNGIWETYSPIAGSPALNGVWGNAEGTMFYAVGNNGSVYSYYTLSPGWNRMVTPGAVAGQALNAVWGAGASNVFAVGNNGVIIHYDGTVWAAMTSGTTNNLISVFGVVGGDVIAAGAAGTVIRCRNGGRN